MGVYGAAGSPSQNTINYDALLTQTLINYRSEMTDNINKSFAIFEEIKKSGMYKSYDGGVAIQENLRIGNTAADTYQGYDALSVDPVDGITAAFYDPREVSAPISISNLEERQNSGRSKIKDMLQTKIYQAEDGIKELFVSMFLQGSYAGSGTSLVNPYVSPNNASLGITPLPALVYYDATGAVGDAIQPTTSLVVGNINQANYSWWRNWSFNMGGAAMTAANFLLQLDSAFNYACRGVMGKPNIGICDQRTFELFRAAYYQAYNRDAPSDNDYPFPNITFNGMRIIWDERVPNVHAGNLDTSIATGKGSMYFLNSKTLGIRYDIETNFKPGPFVRPANQNAKVSHIFWMGTTTTNHRRKNVVIGNIPRTLTLT
jgi:hypothetical protein